MPKNGDDILKSQADYGVVEKPDEKEWEIIIYVYVSSYCLRSNRELRYVPILQMVQF
jgi:hypothetical protein